MSIKFKYKDYEKCRARLKTVKKGGIPHTTAPMSPPQAMLEGPLPPSNSAQLPAPVPSASLQSPHLPHWTHL